MTIQLVRSRHDADATGLFRALGEAKGGLGLDIETEPHGTIVLPPPIVCWQVSDGATTWVVMADAVGLDEPHVREWLEDPDRIKAVHYGYYESAAMYRWHDVTLSGTFDTCEVPRMLLAGLLPGEREACGLPDFSLETTVRRFLGVALSKGDVQTSFRRGQELDSRQVSYAAGDAHFTRLVARPLWQWAKAAGLLDEALLDSEVNAVLARMGVRGVPLDRHMLEVITEQALDDELAATAETVRRLGLDVDDVGRVTHDGKPFSVTSDAQLKRLLSAQTGRDLADVKEATLRRLDHDAAETIVTRRHAHTVVANAAALAGAVYSSASGFVRTHPHWRSAESRTGRMSAREPNICATPQVLHRTVAAPPGQMIGAFDYCRQEVYIIAAESGDARLQEVLVAGDPYETVARRLGSSRNVAKRGLLSAAYGTGEEGLAQTAGIGVDDARAVIRELRREFPKAMGFCHTPRLASPPDAGLAPLCGGPQVFETRGRARRRLVTARRRQAATLAMGNAPVQSTGAAMIKRALVEVDRRLPAGAEVVAAVHDEIVVIADSHLASTVDRIVTDAMAAAAATLCEPYPMPPVEGGWGSTWSEAKP